MKSKPLLPFGVALCSLFALVIPIHAQGNAFTYQGRLTSGTNVANGIYDLRFGLFNAVSSGTQIGPALTNAALAVSNGYFAVTLDFANGAFPGADRWLEIGVRTNGGGTFTALVPRQSLTPSPYAIYAAGVSATGINGTISASSISGLYTNSVTFTNAGNTFSGSGTGLNNVNAATLGGLNSSNFWRTTGNAGTTPGTHFIGTTDNQPLELKVNGVRALRMEDSGDGSDPGTIPDGAPNLIGGSPRNFVGPGVVGATISGGGATNTAGFIDRTNTVLADYGTVGGGLGNRVETGSAHATVAGGIVNIIRTNSNYSTIGGGNNNTIGANSLLATIAGGGVNSFGTNADYSAIGGGGINSIGANATYATVPGGRQNGAAGNYAFAAGRRAQANHDGAFVWADSTDADFPSTATNQFLIRASGGVGINVTNPVDALHVQSAASVRTRTTTTGTGFAGFLSENSLGEWFAGIANATNHWYVYENAPLSGAHLVVKSGGNVGIGTLNPTNKLHVLGGATFSSGAGGANQNVVWTPGSASWSFTSDRHAKEGIAPVDPGEILEKLARVPVAEWNYIGYPQRHIGPMAQDFHAQFPLSGDDKSLNDADLHGVALAAIQGLNLKLTEELNRRDREIAELKHRSAENAELKAELDKLRRMVDKLASAKD